MRGGEVRILEAAVKILGRRAQECWNAGARDSAEEFRLLVLKLAAAIVGIKSDLEMAKEPIREQPELAKRAFGLSEAGVSIGSIAILLEVSRSNAVNLIGYGKRLAAGQPEPEFNHGADLR